MPTLLRYVLVGVASSAATLAGRDLYERAKTTVHRLSTRRRPDHQTIRSGWYNSSTPNDGMYISLKCAPSRAGRRQVVQSEAVRLVSAHFADRFGPEADYASPEGMRFSWSGPDPEHRSSCSLWVRAGGLVELRTPLPFELPDDGVVETPLVDIASEIDRFVRAVSASHSAIFGGCKQLDWYVNLTGGLMVDGVWRNWRPTFVHRVPGGRARETHPGQRADGYGARALLGRKRGVPSVDLVGAVINDLLLNIGYRDYEAAIDDVVAATVAARQSRDGPMQVIG